MPAELDPLSELRFLTEALRAHAEWQQACGTAALPSGSAEIAGSFAAPSGVESRPASSPVYPAAPAPFATPPATVPAPFATPAAAPPSFTLSAVPAPSGAAAPFATSSSAAAPFATPSAAASRQAAAELSQLPLAERRARLTVLAEEARSCTRCALHLTRKQAVFARGNGSSGLCFVGEGPGADEDQQGFPFVGAAGQLLDRMIGAMGIERDDVYVCNIVKCRPPKNRTPEPEEVSACMPYLTEQLALIEPQVIVALGKTAVQGLFGSAEGITRIRGRWRLYQGKIAVMPTFHPAYLLRTPAAKREVWADLQLVLKHLGRTVPGKGA